MWREPGATHDVGVRHLFTAALLAVWLAGAPRAWSFTAARLTITPGTADCGGPALSRPPAAPFAGAIHGDTGCAVPTGDTSGLGRCEAGAAKAFARFAGDMIACEIAQARGVFRKEADSIAIADAAAACKHAAPGNSARARLEAALARLACPADVLSGAAAYESALLAGPQSFDTMNGEIYCDLSAGTLGIDPAGWVKGVVPTPVTPEARRIVGCERSVWRNVARLLKRLGACHTAGALSPGGGADEAACRSAAAARYDAFAAYLAARGTCPPCLDAAAQTALRDRVLAQDRRSSGLLRPCSLGGPALSTISDLGRGCLYLPAGPGIRVPDGATKTVAITSTSGSTLTFAGSDAPSRLECTKSSGPSRHCLTPGNAACATDEDCDDASGGCALDVNCFFIQPIPVPNGALSLCIVDVVETEERGTIDLATGAIDITEHHASRVYLTSNAMSPCPRCVNGLCVGGKNAGGACTAVGSAGTSIDCLPADRAFITALQLHEFFTTGASEKADFGAGFCADQTAAGAFGRTDAVRVTAAGAPGPQIGDGQPHDIVLAGVFCVPPTGTPPIDALVKLPGPGVVSSAAVLDLD